MSNEEIIAILSDIIRNIATRHAYGMLLDLSKRDYLVQDISSIRIAERLDVSRTLEDGVKSVTEKLPD